MLVLGAILIALGVAAVLAALFTTHTEQTVGFAGLQLDGMTVFFLGIAAGACIVWGARIMVIGAKRNMAQRREMKRLHQLNDKLDAAEAERRLEES